MLKSKKCKLNSVLTSLKKQIVTASSKGSSEIVAELKKDYSTFLTLKKQRLI